MRVRLGDVCDRGRAAPPGWVAAHRAGMGSRTVCAIVGALVAR